MGTIKVDTVTGLADPNKVSLSSGATLQVDKIVNVSGDKDSGINLATNDTIKFNIAGAEKARMDSSGNFLVAKTTQESGSAGGAILGSAGVSRFTADGAHPVVIKRKSDDGDIIQIEKDDIKFKDKIDKLFNNDTIIEIGSNSTVEELETINSS